MNHGCRGFRRCRSPLRFPGRHPPRWYNCYDSQYWQCCYSRPLHSPLRAKGNEYRQYRLKQDERKHKADMKKLGIAAIFLLLSHRIRRWKQHLMSPLPALLLSSLREVGDGSQANRRIPEQSGRGPSGLDVQLLFSSASSLASIILDAKQ